MKAIKAKVTMCIVIIVISEILVIDFLSSLLWQKDMADEVDMKMHAQMK